MDSGSIDTVITLLLWYPQIPVKNKRECLESVLFWWATELTETQIGKRRISQKLVVGNYSVVVKQYHEFVTKI